MRAVLKLFFVLLVAQCYADEQGAGTNKPIPALTADQAHADHTTNLPKESSGAEAAKLVPLPNDWLLGARSLEERDTIFEAVVRWIAAKPSYPTYFIGFRNIVKQPIGEYGSNYLLHDPTPEFLHKIKDLEPKVKPLSAAEWVPIEMPLSDGRKMVLGHEVAGHGVRCMIWGVGFVPALGADVDVEFERQDAGKEHFKYHLERDGKKWKVTEEKFIGTLG
jgi:hypothetical protein